MFVDSKSQVHNMIESTPSSFIAVQLSDEVEETFGADQEELFFGIGDNAAAPHAVGCNGDDEVVMMDYVLWIFGVLESEREF